MTETEIQMFIETMEDLGDEWTPEQVKTMYAIIPTKLQSKNANNTQICN